MLSKRYEYGNQCAFSIQDYPVERRADCGAIYRPGCGEAMEHHCRKTGTTARGNDRVKEEASQSVSLSALDTRVHSLEQLTAELHKEVLLSSELIKSLAQQNIQLVQAVDVLRVRTRILFGFCGVLGVVTAACVYLVAAH